MDVLLCVVLIKTPVTHMNCEQFLTEFFFIFSLVECYVKPLDIQVFFVKFDSKTPRIKVLL